MKCDELTGWLIENPSLADVFALPEPERYEAWRHAARDAGSSAAADKAKVFRATYGEEPDPMGTTWRELTEARLISLHLDFERNPDIGDFWCRKLLDYLPSVRLHDLARTFAGVASNDTLIEMGLRDPRLSDPDLAIPIALEDVGHDGKAPHIKGFDKPRFAVADELAWWANQEEEPVAEKGVPANDDKGENHAR